MKLRNNVGSNLSDFEEALEKIAAIEKNEDDLKVLKSEN